MGDSCVEIEPQQSVLSGDALETVRQYASDLAEFGETLGLLGPREYERLWTRHLLNSAVVAPFFVGMRRVADIGSGAGLPGLVLAAMLPDAELHLIEPMERRSQWLIDEAARLGLDNVVVHAKPAQEIIGGQFDGVTSRAVAALRKLIPLAAPLSRVGGTLALIKGQSVATELEDAAKQVRHYHLVDVHVRRVGDGEIPEPTTVLLATVGR